MRDYLFLTEAIRKVVVPATGCTEPVAIALNAATARDNLRGPIRSAKVSMDICLAKNAMKVGIPGIPERGIAMCVAAGLAGGDASRGMEVLGNLDESARLRALELLPLIKVGTDPSRTGLFIETILESDCDFVRVITDGGHDRITLIEHAPFSEYVSSQTADGAGIAGYSIDDLVAFADRVPLENIAFLDEGIKMNQEVAKAGQKLRFGQCMEHLSTKGYLGDSLILKVQQVTACASYARMSGVPLPVMTTTGSGNQGITLFLTISTTAHELGVPREKTLRAIALAQAVNLYAKYYLGTLSALCACGVASGLGAAVGIVYMLGGTPKEMLGSMRNILGSILGMICDGAKEGCANKVSLSSGLAVLSALMALDGLSINETDGVLADDMRTMFENVSRIATAGMGRVNETIIDIMMKKT